MKTSEWFALAPHLTGTAEMQEELQRNLGALFPGFDAGPYTPRTNAEPIAVR